MIRGLILPLLLTASSVAEARPELPASTQSVEQRFERAHRFESAAIRRMLRSASVTAVMTAAGTGIVIRRPGAGGPGYFYLDLAAMAEYPILPAARIAAILAKATGRTVTADTLGMADIDYDPSLRMLRFTALDQRWSIDAGGVATGSGDSGGPADAAAGVLSPDRRYRAVSRGNDLLLVEVATGRTIPLTIDGTPDRPYGQEIPLLSDKVAAHTDAVPPSTYARWSDDGHFLLTMRLDLRGVRTLPVVEHAPRDTLYPRVYHVLYPLAGDAILPTVERFAIDVPSALATGKGNPVRLNVPVQTLLDPYLPSDYWTGSRIRSSWMERGYKDQREYSTDPRSGAAQLLVEESIPGGIVPTATRVFAAAPRPGNYLISERSGWAQLYHVTPDDPRGGRALTRGSWEVLSAQPDRTDPEGLLVVGIGREADRSPYARGLYRVRRNGADPQLLTPEPLDHATTISSDGRWILDSMSSPTRPPELVLRAVADGRIVRVLGRTDPASLAMLGGVPPEPFEGLAADGITRLSGMIYRPAGFDPKRRYPVIDAVYAGPVTHNVPIRWDDAMLSTANGLAQIGAIVVIIDGRGTSFRGRAFRMVAHHAMGEAGIDDHIAMLRQMAARYPAFDLDRVGVIGGSAGGYDAARFMLRRPDFFKVGVAASGNHELRLDKAWWPEVMMTDADQATWDRNSNIPIAGQLRGKLLLVHGELDDNVPVANSLRLADAIYAAGGDVDLLVIPNARHTVPWDLYWHKVYSYFTTYLLRELPPS